MTTWQNTSGTAVSVPTVAQYDIGPGETVDTPDDVLMPANYFQRVDSIPASPAVTVSEEE